MVELQISSRVGWWVNKVLQLFIEKRKTINITNTKINPAPNIPKIDVLGFMPGIGSWIGRCD